MHLFLLLFKDKFFELHLHVLLYFKNGYKAIRNQYLRLSCIRSHIVKPFGIPLPYKRIEGRAIVIFSLDLVYQQKIVVYNTVFM